MFDKTTLNKLKNMKIEYCDIDTLTDIGEIKIDNKRTFYEKIDSFEKQIKNPYLFKVGDTAVKVVFGNSDFEKVLADIFSNGKYYC